ncbi:MAG: hypothetical protein UZ01_00499 [Candidatus Brocadia sinica]|nr:MAG: hypothetical protein UZ01_00499 [Candidatus Brocadia sinica]
MAIHDLSGVSRAITAVFVLGLITLNPADPAWAQAQEMKVKIKKLKEQEKPQGFVGM